MYLDKADIRARLKREILPLQGFKPSLHCSVLDLGLGPIADAFPNQTFPMGVIHEFICKGREDAAATTGFIAGIVAALMKNGGSVLWIQDANAVFPPALKSYGISPENIVFISLKNQKDILWCMEEALRCNSLSAVIGELKDLDFTASRRFQLAVEQTKVTGFLLRNTSRNIGITASHARWQVKPLPSQTVNGMPGVGFPNWNVQLLKVRNGRPGSWQVEFVNNSFRHMENDYIMVDEEQRKAG